MANVLRNTIKEDRGNYFVEYRPADVASYLAMLNLVFPETAPGLATVADLMERELDHWLRRYRVPTMVYAWDAVENQITPAEFTGDSPLVGYFDEGKDRVVKHWGLISDGELPQEQRRADYQAHAYKDLPFRLQSEVRESAIRKARPTARAVRTIAFFVVGFPILIELVSLGVPWLGHLLAFISIAAGLLHVSRTMGWLKPSKNRKERADEELRKDHYFYHCERNPAGFDRLIQENMERELLEKTKTEAVRVKNAVRREEERSHER